MPEQMMNFRKINKSIIPCIDRFLLHQSTFFLPGRSSQWLEHIIFTLKGLSPSFQHNNSIILAISKVSFSQNSGTATNTVVGL